MEMLVVDASELKERLRKEQAEFCSSNQFATSEFCRGISIGYDYSISLLEDFAEPMKEHMKSITEVLKWPKKADSTLMKYSKKQLIELLREAEHNRDVAIETLEQQYQNIKDWEPVVHAHWWLERTPDGKPYCFHCSHCDADGCIIRNSSTTDYCPDCGAKMDEEEGNTDEN